MAAIAYRVFALAAEQSRVPRDSLSVKTDLDSLARDPEDFWWLIRFLEKEWGIDISEEDQLALDTLGELIEYVQEMVEKKKHKQSPVAA